MDSQTWFLVDLRLIEFVKDGPKITIYISPLFCVVNKKDTLIKSEDKTSAKVASEVVKENVEIAPPSPYANNDTFDATNDEFNDDYNEDVTDEVLEEKDDLVQINVEDIKGLFLSEDTDVFVITDEHFISLKLKIWILVTENCSEIENVF